MIRWFGLALIAAQAAAQEATYHDVTPEPGRPFGQIVVRNLCGPDDTTIRVETPRGVVVLEWEETDSSCGAAPDVLTVRDLPPGVAANPMQLELTEAGTGPSEPQTINLWNWEGM